MFPLVCSITRAANIRSFLLHVQNVVCESVNGSNMFKLIYKISDSGRNLLQF